MGRPESVAAGFFHQFEEAGMADIAKVIRVIGQSPTSFAEAAKVAVQEASKTVRDIHGAHVVEMSAVVENDQITLFRTTVDIAFGVER
jgi:dodecin